MSDLTTYRLPDPLPRGRNIEVDELIPDTRLQAIADAPRCKHGNIYPHIDGDSVTSDPGIARWYICQGSPEKAALLDGLVGAK